LEDSDSGGDIHPDSGTDRTGHYELHGCDDVRIEKRGRLHNGRLHLKNDNKSKFILHFIRFALPLHPIWLKQQ
jgi:hypothetical protein